MAPADFADVIDVHLIGAANATMAVWNTMREQGYGRLLMVSSTTGLGGNFGQANYGAAKMGLIGLAKTLHMEGAKYGIRVNCLAPLAGTRMTEDIFPEESYAAFAPDKVVPGALFLVSDAAPSNVILGAGAGWFHTAQITVSPGVVLPESELTVEGVAAAWNRIADRTGDFVLHTGMEQSTIALDKLAADKSWD